MLPSSITSIWISSRPTPSGIGNVNVNVNWEEYSMASVSYIRITMMVTVTERLKMRENRIVNPIIGSMNISSARRREDINWTSVMKPEISNMYGCRILRSRMFVNM